MYTEWTKAKEESIMAEFTRRQLLDRLAKDVSTKDLDRIDQLLPGILTEAVRELNGEVEYVMKSIKK